MDHKFIDVLVELVWELDRFDFGRPLTIRMWSELADPQPELEHYRSRDNRAELDGVLDGSVLYVKSFRMTGDSRAGSARQSGRQMRWE